MASAGVDAAVVVPPTFAGEPNDVALEAASEFPGRFAVMGRIDLTDVSLRREIPRWRRQRGLYGLRLTFTRDAARWLTDGTAAWFWAEAELHNLPVMVFVPGQLETLPEILASHPGLRIAIDHLGLSDGSPSHVIDATVARLAEQASQTSLTVKASALLLHSHQPYPHRDMAMQVRKLVDAFGPMRVFWGSDFTRASHRYRASVTYLEDSGLFTENELDAIMGDALCDWLGWRPQMANKDTGIG